MSKDRNIPFDFPQALSAALRSHAIQPELLSVIEYATLPAGKLFRPRLVESLAHDLALPMEAALVHWALAIELHHAYTLIHDDLPCMDNDDIRRGKASTHKQFGEWRALLAGDTLSVISFAECLRIQHPSTQLLVRLLAWGTGPKGLILGQWLDLSWKGGKFQNIIRIHQLKTARLMQLSLIGTRLLAGTDSALNAIKWGLRVGQSIGVVFQLLDDLSDLVDLTEDDHEANINPFYQFPQEALSYLTEQLKLLEGHMTGTPLLRSYIAGFVTLARTRIAQDRVILAKHFQGASAQAWNTFLTTDTFV